MRKVVNASMNLPLVMPREPPAFGDVHLGAFRPDDVPLLQDRSTDPYVPLTGTLPAHADRADALAYIDRQHARLATGAGYSFCAGRCENPMRRPVKQGCRSHRFTLAERRQGTPSPPSSEGEALPPKR